MLVSITNAELSVGGIDLALPILFTGVVTLPLFIIVERTSTQAPKLVDCRTTVCLTTDSDEDFHVTSSKLHHAQWPTVLRRTEP